MLKKIIEDKRILALYIIVIIALIIGFTYALNDTSLAINIDTALMGVDEEVYGDTTFDSTSLDFKPILDSEIELRDGVIVDGVEEKDEINVIRIDFTVGGASTNEFTDIIYDIALVDLEFDDELLSPYIKWRLIKNGVQLSGGDFTQTIKNNRLVLTDTQEDLPVYSETQAEYHNYTFYMWFSDSCQNEDITTCFNKIDQSELVGKNFSGKIEVELYGSENKSNVSLKLNEVAVGSYVKYAGNNGCDTTSVNGWNSCSGKNANYVDDTNMGQCPSSSYKFSKNGWRVGYIKDGSAHLVAAGATDCMCTDSSGNPHSDTCSDYVIGDNLYKHIDNMDNLALKYCNTNYAKDGVCNNTTAWAIDENDYEIILNETLEIYDISIRNNELMLPGADYWFGTIDSTSSNFFHYWNQNQGYVSGDYSNRVYGVRPVLSLDSSVIVVGGNGTYEDPYIINK